MSGSTRGHGMHLLHVVGARPNFMKVAPVLRACDAGAVSQTLVHTGQHYDVKMSRAILEELQIREPDINLGIGSGSHAQQTAAVMVRMEEILLDRKPDWLFVYGDVNSTLAAALAAAKTGVPIAHVEAGLRSGDRAMPEEVNRLVADRLAQLLFTPSSDADANLLREGVPGAFIHCVGNVMIDTLVALLPRAEAQRATERLGFGTSDAPKPFALVTLHRPSNVDDDTTLRALMAALSDIAGEIPIVFPMHPRTRARLAGATFDGMTVTEPLTYLEFLGLEKNATLVITDSGGVQEETTFLGVPCLTMRENTERPVTVSQGTNQLIGKDVELLKSEVGRILNGDAKRGVVPPLWDGRASERIAEIVCR